MCLITSDSYEPGCLGSTESVTPCADTFTDEASHPGPPSVEHPCAPQAIYTPVAFTHTSRYPNSAPTPYRRPTPCRRLGIAQQPRIRPLQATHTHTHRYTARSRPTDGPSHAATRAHSPYRHCSCPQLWGPHSCPTFSRVFRHLIGRHSSREGSPTLP